MPRQKRTLEEAIEENGGDLLGDFDDEYDSSEDYDIVIDQNADQVRRRIRTFLDSGAMKVGEFQQAIRVNSRSWHMFMKQSGPYKGTGSTVFRNAFIYFKRREEQGLKMPKKPRVSKAKTAEDDSALDVEGMRLDGDEEDRVPVYDSCDDVRRKIEAHLKLPSVTQAKFLRALGKQYRMVEDKKIQSKQLSDFRSKTGPYAGNTSAVYYGAYCYFEKLRIKEGKGKTEKREDNEAAHPNGFDRDTRHDEYGWRIVYVGRA